LGARSPGPDECGRSIVHQGEQPYNWPITLAIAAVLALACVLVVPPVLHPPLSSADLEGVTSAEKRIELQQAQAKLRDDVRATLLQAIAGLLLLLGAFATWRHVQISREGQITERFSRAIEQLGSDKEEVRLASRPPVQDGEPGAAGLAAQHAELMAEHQDLQILGACIGMREDQQAREHPDE